MKRIFRHVAIFTIIFLHFLLFTTQFAYAEKIPNHTSNFYVNDFANVFSQTQIKEMMSKALLLYENYNGVQVVVTTVESMGNQTIDNYATEMYNQYKIGKNSMGVLIVMSVKDRKICLRTGTTMQTYISNTEAEKLLNENALPKLNMNMYAEGLIDLQSAVITKISTILTPINLTESTSQQPNPTSVLIELGFIFLGFYGFHFVFKDLNENSNSKSKSYYTPHYYGSSSSNNTSYHANSYSCDSSSYIDTSSYSGCDGSSSGGGASADF